MKRLTNLLLILLVALVAVCMLQWYIVATREIVRCDGGGYA